MNPSQLLSLGGVWRLSTLPAGHDVYVLPYAIKWCGLSIVNCFRRWILFFAIFWFSLRENHNKMNEHLLFWKHLCAYINVSWHWLARKYIIAMGGFFLLFKRTYTKGHIMHRLKLWKLSLVSYETFCYFRFRLTASLSVKYSYLAKSCCIM